MIHKRKHETPVSWGLRMQTRSKTRRLFVDFLPPAQGLAAEAQRLQRTDLSRGSLASALPVLWGLTVQLPP